MISSHIHLVNLVASFIRPIIHTLFQHLNQSNKQLENGNSRNEEGSRVQKSNNIIHKLMGALI